jgi:hypothetical protein
MKLARGIGIALLMTLACACARKPASTTEATAGPAPPASRTQPSASASSQSAAANSRQSAAAPNAPDLDAAVLAYGYGPEPNAHVTWQPDVVVVGGGPKAIRGVETGLRWILDANAPGARDLAPGKVMFVTSRAVGRIVDVESRGSTLAVRVAPVALTDVLRDAHIDFDRAIPFESLRFYRLDAIAPPVVRNPDGSIATAQPALWYRNSGRGSFLPVTVQSGSVADKFAGKVSIGDWEVEPYLRKSVKMKDTTDAVGRVSSDRRSGFQFGLKLQRSVRSVAGLKLGGDVNLYGSQLHVRSHTNVVGGQVDRSTFVIDGVEGVEVALLGGVANGSSDNVKARLELPFELTTDLPPSFTGGVPMVMHWKMKMLVETAFSGRNSTLQAHGNYALQGPLGIDGGTVQTPTLSVVEPMLPSIKGITIGPSGIVFAVEFRALLGFGIPNAMAGPYGKMIVAVGVSRGSALGVSLADCRSVTLKVDGGIGVGAVVDPGVWSFLKALNVRKAEFEINETMFNVYNLTRTIPDVPLCRN